jgi:hypothetical protein
MPAGLDGNPDPVRSPQRDAVLDHLVDRVTAVGEPRTFVGIDGAPGTGKSTLADELTARLRDRGRAPPSSSTTTTSPRPRSCGVDLVGGDRMDAPVASAILGRLSQIDAVARCRTKWNRELVGGDARLTAGA